jgi:hypothetical protein
MDKSPYLLFWLFDPSVLVIPIAAQPTPKAPLASAATRCNNILSTRPHYRSDRNEHR